MDLAKHVSTVISSLVLAGVIWIGSNMVDAMSGIVEIKTVQTSMLENQKEMKIALDRKAEKEVVTEMKENLQNELNRLWAVARDNQKHVAILEAQKAIEKEKAREERMLEKM